MTIPSGAPVDVGMPCEVRVRPMFPDARDFDCKLLVRCVDRVLFPNYARCTAEDGRVRTAKDGAFTPDEEAAKPAPPDVEASVA